MVFTIPALINGQSSPYLILYMLVEAVTVFAIGYLAMLKSAVRYGQLLDEEVADTTRSPLDDALVASLTAKLNAVMQDAQAYKKNDLRLSELAEMTDVSKEILSKYINQHCHKNFYEYVNEYRVKAAAALLAVDEKANIEKVAFDAGFNNRVSFHHAFKKLTGKTPSQYRRGERAKGCTVSETHGQPARAT